MYIQGTQIEIQSPTHWNLIGCRMTATLPVLSPSSILPPHSSHSAFILVKNKFNAIFKMLLCNFFLLFFFKLSWSVKLSNLKLLTTGSICIRPRGCGLDLSDSDPSHKGTFSFDRSLRIYWLAERLLDLVEWLRNADRLFENVAKLKQFEMSVTIKNLMTK
jgi:hypothetical protein